MRAHRSMLCLLSCATILVLSACGDDDRGGVRTRDSDGGGGPGDGGGGAGDGGTTTSDGGGTVADSGGGATLTCDTFAACGGDIEGTWSIAEACEFNIAAVNEMCPTAEVDTSALSITGTSAFQSDGSYTVMTQVSGTAMVEIPASCIPPIIASCDQINSADLTCTGDPMVMCSCTANLDETDTTSGTYEVQGTAAILMETGATESETVPYCVAGNGDLWVETEAAIFRLTR